jgi:hypothetical protein
VFVEPILTRIQIQHRQMRSASHRARIRLDAEKKKCEKLEKEKETLTRQMNQNATSFYTPPVPFYNPFLQHQFPPPPAAMAAASSSKTATHHVAAETESESDSENEKDEELRRFVEIWTKVQRQNKRRE